MSEVDILINSLESKLKISEDVNTSMSYTSCKSINERISKEVCNDTIKAISDIECLDRYKSCESLKKNVVSLTTVLKNNSIEKYAVATDIDSDILLESYSSFYPTKYNYYARNSFVYNENLRYIERDLNSFVV